MGLFRYSTRMIATFAVLGLPLVGCSAQLDDVDAWQADDLETSDFAVESELADCSAPPVASAPEVTLETPVNGSDVTPGNALEMNVEVRTCRKLTAVYAEITEPSFPTDKAPKIHKYGLARVKGTAFDRAKIVGVPKKARLGRHTFRLVVTSLRPEVREVNGRMRTVNVSEDFATNPIGFDVKAVTPEGPLVDAGTSPQDSGVPTPEVDAGNPTQPTEPTQPTQPSLPLPSGALATTTCGAGKMLFNGSCIAFGASAQTAANVCSKYKDAYQRTATWNWRRDTRANATACSHGYFPEIEGKTSQQAMAIYLQKAEELSFDAVQRLNFVRWLIGAAPVQQMPVTQGDLECATMLRENGSLLHGFPQTNPSTGKPTKCWTAAGSLASSSDLLASATTPISSLSAYLDERYTQGWGHRSRLISEDNDWAFVNTGGAGCAASFPSLPPPPPRQVYAYPAHSYLPFGPQEMAVQDMAFSVGNGTPMPNGTTFEVRNIATGQLEPVQVYAGPEVSHRGAAFRLLNRPTATSGYEVTFKANGKAIYQYAFQYIDCGG